MTHFETALRIAQERADENAEKSLQTALGVHTLVAAVVPNVCCLTLCPLEAPNCSDYSLLL